MLVTEISSVHLPFTFLRLSYCTKFNEIWDNIIISLSVTDSNFAYLSITFLRLERCTNFSEIWDGDTLILKKGLMLLFFDIFTAITEIHATKVTSQSQKLNFSVIFHNSINYHIFLFSRIYFCTQE